MIEHALARVAKEQGPGALPSQASSLARRLYGFEVMVGPYAVSELRASRALKDRGGDLPAEGTGVYLADTLDSPDAEPQQMGLVLQPIADQRSCPLPQVERFRSMSAKARLEHRQEGALLADFSKPVSDAGHGGALKNLYNKYVYFWRWALWKVFEQEAAEGPSIVSFITASSYLFGAAFAGVREQMRRLCDEIWILDLGGEGRGGRQEENVFAIQTKGAGKRSSPLDKIRPERWTAQLTTDLLDLLHTLEETVDIQPEQGRLLDEVLAGNCFRARELPPAPEEARRDPRSDETSQATLYQTDA